MIIEDDPNLAELLKTELEENGIKTIISYTGEEAWTVLKVNKPRAIVLDIMLDSSGMNGWKWIEKVKAEEHYRDIPIFISSALDEKSKGISLGAQEYLVKPYQASKLTNILLQTLSIQETNAHIWLPEGK